ncbi:hypothetical protein [Euzebya tangerina]|uniref:hypothetical protein n=1 Tax=Euzebya tangerina TaxID=591198 RepID=UPI000E30B6AE|nr:hypothetical protein [Euzebya tangerina]
MADLLDDAKRVVLAWPGRTVPLLSPMAFWWDGRNVWFSTSSASVKARMLGGNGECALYVPPVDDGDDGLVARGQARVFGLADPVGLATHAGILAAAQAALMLKNAQSMVGYLTDAPKIPREFLPPNRVLVRVALEDHQSVVPPGIGKGIAPGLPTEVPPEIRRSLGGARRVVLATQADGVLGLMPAVWGAGFSLVVPKGMVLQDGSAVTAVLDHDPGFRPTEVAGISLSGTVTTSGPKPKLQPEKVRWWSGFDLDTAEVSSSPTSTIVIPD